MAVESFGDIHALPDDCIANVLSLTSPKDACRLSAVAATFRSASQSDTVWDRFLPSDYRDLISRAVGGSDSLLAKSNSKKDLYLHLCDHPILIDSVRKSIYPGSVSEINSDIPELKGDNYKVWRERVLLQLGWMDIDYAIRKDEPSSITEASSPDKVDLYEKWERSNRLSVMFIKTKICASIRGSVDKHNNVRDLLKAIDEQFAHSEKALASTLIMEFSSMRHNGLKGVRDYIMHMRDIAAKLKDLEVTMSETFLSFSLEKWSGKKCYMLAARELVIEWGDSSQYWKWITLPESRFSEVAELLNVCWFEIRGKIKSEMLSPGTNYAAYLVYTWKFTAYGFEEQGAKAFFVHKSEKRSVSLYTDGAQRQRIQFVPRGLSGLFSHRTDRIQQEATMETNSEYPKQRSDGWMEVKLGEYFVKEDGGDLEVCLVEVNDGNWKSGLIIQGIEIRPEIVNN
ncbi:hypothetical protein CASFOL_024644 [Castilleja foliolosa]|uniref:F-box domain-containing protein n=1 Tax=Castilleja foliolosa TaxID=1961234 RepID=A0ABD3CSI3_9LAMI